MAAVLSRLSSRIVLGVAAVLMLGVSLAWLYAAQKLGDYLHQPAFNGATLADFCGASEIGGFPFRLKLTCNGLKAPLGIDDNALVFTADEVKGAANLWSPDHVTLSFSSPVALRSAKGGFAKLRHDGATLDFVWDDERGLTQAAVNGRALDWRPEVLEAGPAFNLQTLRFAAHPSSRDGVPSLRVEAGADGLTAPFVQSLLGNSAPNDIAVAGDLFPLLPPNDDWRQALEDWRHWGALTAKFAAALSLDDAHRLAGTVKVNAHGAEQLARRLGLPLAPGATNALLGALLGQKPPEMTQDKPGDDGIAFTVRLAQGAIYLGPLQVGVLTPLY
jgi:hypothetical protein